MTARERKAKLNRERQRKWYDAHKRKTPDMVNHPPHYTTGKIEVIDFIEDQRFGYCDGQVIKYVSRFRHKGNAIEDLKKARWYLDRLIKQQP